MGRLFAASPSVRAITIVQRHLKVRVWGGAAGPARYWGTRAVVHIMVHVISCFLLCWARSQSPQAFSQNWQGGLFLQIHSHMASWRPHCWGLRRWGELLLGWRLLRGQSSCADVGE